jgi:hypothetical protein
LLSVSVSRIAWRLWLADVLSAATVTWLPALVLHEVS